MRRHKLSKENKKVLVHIIIAVIVFMAALLGLIFLFMLGLNAIFHIHGIKLITEYSLLILIVAIVINMSRLFKKKK